MAKKGSISEALSNVKKGDAAGQEKLWACYFQQLADVARRKLKGRTRRWFDGEDVALSVLESFFARAERGEFAGLKHGSDLWKMLVVITARKASNYNKFTHRQTRGGDNRVVGESGLAGQHESSDSWGIEQLSDHAPTPDFIVALDEECEARLNSLPDEILRKIAMQRLEGRTVQEIADALDMSKRTVERKITLIRALWAEDKTP